MAEGGSVKHFVKGDLVMGDFGEARRASLPPGSTVVDDFGNMVEKDGKKIKPPIKPSMYSRVLRKVPYLGAALTTAEGIQALVDSDTGTASEDLDPIAAMQGTQGGYARPERKRDVYAELKESTRAESAPQKPQFNFPPQGGVGPTDAELGRNAPAPAAPEMFKEPAADQGLSDIKSLLKQRMEESGKQKRIDAYMSLLQAGLGMMGGSSPFASVNIGQGAAQGVAAQMAARKSQVADENAILTGQLGLSRAELYEKMRRDALRQQAERTAGELKIKEGNLDVNRQKVLGQQRKNYLTAQKQFMDQGGQLDIENRYKTQYGKNWKNDPNHLRNFNLEVKARINELAGSIGDDDIPLSSNR
jgi:hypothetical protein